MFASFSVCFSFPAPASFGLSTAGTCTASQHALCMIIRPHILVKDLYEWCSPESERERERMVGITVHFKRAFNLMAVQPAEAMQEEASFIWSCERAKWTGKRSLEQVCHIQTHIYTHYQTYLDIENLTLSYVQIMLSSIQVTFSWKKGTEEMFCAKE